MSPYRVQTAEDTCEFLQLKTESNCSHSTRKQAAFLLLIFSPDGTQIAVGGLSGTIWILNANDGTMVRFCGGTIITTHRFDKPKVVPCPLQRIDTMFCSSSYCFRAFLKLLPQRIRSKDPLHFMHAVAFASYFSASVQRFLLLRPNSFLME